MKTPLRYFVLFLLLFSLAGCRSNSEERWKVLFSDAAILRKQYTKVTERWAREIIEVWTVQNGAKFPSNRDWFISRGEKISPVIDESARLANEMAAKYEQASRSVNSDRDKRGLALFAASARKDVEITQLAKALVQLASDRTINDKETLNERAGALMRSIQKTQKQSDEQFDEAARLLRNK